MIFWVRGGFCAELSAKLVLLAGVKRESCSKYVKFTNHVLGFTLSDIFFNVFVLRRFDDLTADNLLID